jgi:hypothetical protein
MKILWERPISETNAIGVPLVKDREKDTMGVLAGCLKRRWLVDRRKADAEKALELYSQGFAWSETSVDLQQVLYYGSNLSFMQLVYGRNLDAAAKTAEKLVKYSEQADPTNWWRSAAESQAYLILHKTEAALERYDSAVKRRPQPRQLRAMYEHATRINEYFKDEETQNRLDDIFGRKQI